MKKCYDCTHVEMCGWRKEVKEQGCEFFGDGIVWIPCSERLPEKDELVLVTVWDSVSIAWRNIYGGWESAEDMYTKGDVTAWMPLPKPYREESEAEE